MAAFEDALALLAGDFGMDMEAVETAAIPPPASLTASGAAAATIVPPTVPATPAASAPVSPNASADSGGTDSSVAGHKRKRTQTRTLLEESSAATVAAADGRPAKVARRSRPPVSPELVALRQQREADIALMRSVLEGQGYAGERLEERLAQMLRNEQLEWAGGEPDPALEAAQPQIYPDDAARHMGRVLHMYDYVPMVGVGVAAAPAAAAAAAAASGGGGGGHLAAALRAVEAALRGEAPAAAAAAAAGGPASIHASGSAAAAPVLSLAATMGGASPLAASAAALRGEIVRQWTEMHLPPLQATAAAAARRIGLRAGAVTVAPGLHVVVDQGRFCREGGLLVVQVGGPDVAPAAAAASPRPPSTSSAPAAVSSSPHAAAAAAAAPAASAAGAASSPSARGAGDAAAVKRNHSAASTASASSNGSTSASRSPAASAAPVSPAAASAAPGRKGSNTLRTPHTKQALLDNYISPRNGSGQQPWLSPSSAAASTASAADANVSAATGSSSSSSAAAAAPPSASAAALLRQTAALHELELHDHLRQQLAELRAECCANACAVGPPINILPSLAADCSVYRAMVASSAPDSSSSSGMLLAEASPSAAEDPLGAFRGVATGLVRRFGWDVDLLRAGAATAATRDCSSLTASPVHAGVADGGVPLIAANCPSPDDPAAVMRACVDTLAADPVMALASTIGCGHGYGLHAALLPALLPIDDALTQPVWSAGPAVAASTRAAAQPSAASPIASLPLQQLLGLPAALHLGAHAGVAAGGGGLASDSACSTVYGGGAAVRLSFSGHALPQVSVAVASVLPPTVTSGSAATPVRSSTGSTGIAPPFSQRGGSGRAASASSGAIASMDLPSALLRCISDAANSAGASGVERNDAAHMLPIDAFFDALRSVGCTLDGSASSPSAEASALSSSAGAPLIAVARPEVTAPATLESVVSATTAPLLSALRDRQIACTLISAYADALAFSIAQHAVALSPVSSSAAAGAAGDLRAALIYAYSSASLEQLAAIICRLLIDPVVRGVVVPASRVRPLPAAQADIASRSQVAGPASRARRGSGSDDDSGSHDDADELMVRPSSAAVPGLLSSDVRLPRSGRGDVLALGATTIDGRSPVDAASFLAHTVGGAAIGRSIATVDALGSLGGASASAGSARASSSSSSTGSGGSGGSAGSSRAPAGMASVALAARRMPNAVPALMRLLCTVADVLAWRELIGSLTPEERTITATGKRVAGAVRRTGSGVGASAPGTPARAGSGAGAASGRSPSRMLSPARGADDDAHGGGAVLSPSSSSASGAPSLLRPHDAVAADTHYCAKIAAYVRYYKRNTSAKGHEEATLLPPQWAMHVVDAVVPAVLPEAFQAIDAVHGAATGAGSPPSSASAVPASTGAASSRADSSSGTPVGADGSTTGLTSPTGPDTRAAAAAFSAPVQHATPAMGALVTLAKTLQQHVAHAAAPRLFAYPAALVPVCAAAGGGGCLAAGPLAAAVASSSTTESVLTISSSESSSSSHQDHHAHTLRLSWSCYSVAVATNSPLASLARHVAFISANAATLLWFPRRTFKAAVPRALSAVQQDWLAAVERSRSAHPPVLREADDRSERSDTEEAEPADGLSSSSSPASAAASSSSAVGAAGARSVGTATENQRAHEACTAGIMRFNEVIADDPTVAVPLLAAVPTVLLTLATTVDAFAASDGGVGRLGAFVFPTRYDVLRLPNMNPSVILRSLLQRVVRHIPLATSGGDVAAVAERLAAAGGDAAMLSAAMKVLERQMVTTQLQVLRTALLLLAVPFPPSPPPPMRSGAGAHALRPLGGSSTALPTSWVVSPDGDAATTTIGTTGQSLLLTGGGALASLAPGRLPLFSGVGALAALPRAAANRLRPTDSGLEKLVAAPLLANFDSTLKILLEGRSSHDLQAAIRGMLWAAELPLPMMADDHNDV